MLTVSGYYYDVQIFAKKIPAILKVLLVFYSIAMLLVELFCMLRVFLYPSFR